MQQPDALGLDGDIDDSREENAKQVWEPPSINEAFIGEVTEAIGLGNNDGAASHS